MRAELTRSYRFEAAHRLPRVPADHKCARMHGHGFRVDVVVRGPVGADSGWVVDFADIDRAARPLVDALDHRTLNEIEGLGNPTSEILAKWIWDRLAAALPGLAEVAVCESETSRCAYRGE
jgi:6-pyruvoyltetrahydropterin/6-carboxytetrahydropterin synthase